MFLQKNLFSETNLNSIRKIIESFYSKGFIFSPVLVEVQSFSEYYSDFQEFMISQFSNECNATLGHWWFYLYTKLQLDSSIKMILAQTLVNVSFHYGYLLTLDEMDKFLEFSLGLIKKVYNEANKLTQTFLLISFETDLLYELDLTRQSSKDTSTPISMINALYGNPTTNQEPPANLGSALPERPNPDIANVNVQLSSTRSVKKDTLALSDDNAVQLIQKESLKNKKIIESISAADLSPSKYVQTLNPKTDIHIELPLLHPMNYGEYKDYLRYYKSRFLQLSSIIIKNVLEDEKKILISDISTLRVDQPVFAIGFVEQVNNVSINRGNIKTLEQQVQFHCVDPIYQYILIITLEQKNIIPFSTETIPYGIVVGFSGKITDIDRQKALPIIKIQAERYYLPSSKDSSLPASKVVDKQRPTDSYALVVGAVNYQIKPVTNSWQNLLNWLQTPHKSYRIKYVFFIGGILSPLQFQGQFKSTLYSLAENSTNIGEMYKKFFSDLQSLPSSLEYFFVPGIADITRKFFPQSPLAPKYRLHLPNFHYLSNPGKIILEDEPIILYNPYTFYLSKQPLYQEKGARLLFELLEYRLLYPDWLQERHVLPDAVDYLVIDKLPTSFLAAHPSKTEIPVYSKILAATVASFDSVERPSSAVLYNIKNPSKREIITF